MNSFYTSHLFICTNRRDCGHKRGSCATRGAEELRAYAKQRVKELKLPRARVNSAGCLGRCELGPVMVIYPEGTWYHIRSKEDVDAILIDHLINGQPIDRLRLTNEQRNLAGGPAPEIDCGA